MPQDARAAATVVVVFAFFVAFLVGWASLVWAAASDRPALHPASLQTLLRQQLRAINADLGLAALGLVRVVCANRVCKDVLRLDAAILGITCAAVCRS